MSQTDKEFDFTAKTLEEVLERMSQSLEKDDTFTITFRNGIIVSVKVLEVERTN